jgi:hypothetical protein
VGSWHSDTPSPSRQRDSHQNPWTASSVERGEIATAIASIINDDNNEDEQPISKRRRLNSAVSKDKAAPTGKAATTGKEASTSKAINAQSSVKGQGHIKAQDSIFCAIIWYLSSKVSI